MILKKLSAALLALGLVAPAFGADKPVTLKVLSATITEGVEGETEQSFADAFMKQNPNVTIKFIGVPNSELYAKANTLAISGQMPDVFMNSPEFMTQADDLGIVADLSESFGAEYFDGFAKGPLAMSVIEDKYQFAPWFTIPVTLLYRQDIFDEAGLEPPKTWDEFREVAKKLTVDVDSDGKVDRWGFAMIGTNNGSGASRFFQVLRSHGAAELIPDGDSWKTQFDTPAAVSAFKLLSDLVKDGSVPPGPLQTGYSQAVSLIANDKAAMMITGPHTIGSVLSQNPDLKGKLAGAVLPSVEGVDPDINLGMFGWAIAESSKHKDVAADYIKFVLNKENQITWNTATGRLPTRLDALEATKGSRPELKGFMDAAQFGYQPPVAKFYPKLFSVAGGGYQAVLIGQKSPEDAAKDAAKETERLISNDR